MNAGPDSEGGNGNAAAEEASSGTASVTPRMPKAIRKRLRAAAVAKVRQDIIHAGRSESDYAQEDLEYLVAEKEKEIWSGLGWKGFGVVALLLGINIGI